MEHVIRIAQLGTIEELKSVQRLEELIWGNGSTPLQQMLTAVKNGGMVLGLYADGILAGFQYSFTGFKNGQVYLCSHLLGIHPEYRGKGFGKRLKWAQKEEASKKGYTLITWTYDPLESVNARLNISTLKAFSRTYVKDCYGDLGGILNHGLESDRFIVEWLPDHRHIGAEYLYTSKADPDLIQIGENTDGLPFLKTYDFLQFQASVDRCEPILVPIPANFQKLKKENIELAKQWRKQTRELFQYFFSAGYVACETMQYNKGPCLFYVLYHESQLNIPAQRLS
ncbi:GNAT family N-acetyltransferase [Bacillus sp. 1P06AnD]|uniref:GNAT family N-acetyltransferase n=1 Tax=Bacillus sp. 1P06AnD TaxID=3132208 RepID=UPI0039A0ABE2